MRVAGVLVDDARAIEQLEVTEVRVQETIRRAQEPRSGYQRERDDMGVIRLALPGDIAGLLFHFFVRNDTACPTRAHSCIASLTR